jgi:transcriptional regulator with XRE-family HTH domain
MLRLEAERRAKGWSKSEFARQAGMHLTTVVEATTGKRRPGSAQLAKLAKALGVPLADAEELLQETTDDAG